MIIKTVSRHSGLSRQLRTTADWTLLRYAHCPVLLIDPSRPPRPRKVLAAVKLHPGNNEYTVLNEQVVAPLAELDELLARFPRGMAPRQSGLAMEGVDWRPAANITETDKEYTIKADLPEVKKEDIDVSVSNGVLTLSGERRYEKSSEDEKEHRRETFHGSFERSFALPEDVDVEAINADTKDGVLVVHLPKQAVKKPASVKIKVQ